MSTGDEFFCWFAKMVCYFPLEGDVYKAQTPDKEAQEALEALEVREDPEVKVEVPVDQVSRKGWGCLDSAVSAPTSPIPVFSILTPKFSLASRRFC